MNPNILNSEVQNFIAAHLHDDLKQLALDGIELEGVSRIEVLEQIQAKKKAKDKIPEWFQTDNIIFPPKINLEQTSSSITAKYKASLISGKNVLDLTGGFGVDTYFLSFEFDQIKHCEIDLYLSEIVLHNFKSLGRKNVEFIQGNGFDYLKNNPEVKMDWIYLDPARRDDRNKKVFQLKDTTPNILYHLEELFAHTDNILLKTSPLLDLSLGIKHLKHVAEIHIVGFNNEVKELVWMIRKNWDKSPIIKTIDFGKLGVDRFEFNREEDLGKTISIASPLNYLYEPNACIMKSGGFASLGEQLGLAKLNVNSHLYTSEALMDFPGRKFVILRVIPYNKKTVRKLFGKQKHNVTTRNFTLKVSDIRHLFHIEDGGDSYLFFTTNKDNKKIIIECAKA